MPVNMVYDKQLIKEFKQTQAQKNFEQLRPCTHLAGAVLGRSQSQASSSRGGSKRGAAGATSCSEGPTSWSLGKQERPGLPKGGSTCWPKTRRDPSSHKWQQQLSSSYHSHKIQPCTETLYLVSPLVNASSTCTLTTNTNTSTNV